MSGAGLLLRGLLRLRRTEPRTAATLCRRIFSLAAPVVASSRHLHHLGPGVPPTTTEATEAWWRRAYASDAVDAGLGEIIEVQSMKDFQSLAEASKSAPIILDFYADWCGPCKTLSPKLDQAAKASKKFNVAKIDVEAQDLAPLVQHLKISSLPTLMVLFDGQIIANSVVVGVPDDGKFAAYVKMIEGLEASKAAAEGKGEGDGGPAAAEGEEPKPDFKAIITEHMGKLSGEGVSKDIVAEAARAFSGVLSHEASELGDAVRAKVGLAMCALKEGNADVARQLARSAEGDCAENQKFGELEALKAQLDFIEQGGAGSVSEAQARVDADPGDLEALHDLATALFAEGRSREALDAALEIVRKDKTWNDEAGRKLVVKLFDLLGKDDDLVRVYRQKLSNILFI